MPKDGLGAKDEANFAADFCLCFINDIIAPDSGEGRGCDPPRSCKFAGEYISLRHREPRSFAREERDASRGIADQSRAALVQRSIRIWLTPSK